MKHVLLLIAILFAGHSAPCQTNGQDAAFAPNAQQQGEAEIPQQPHAARPIPPPPATTGAQGQIGRGPAADRWRDDPSAKVGDGDRKDSKESGLERGLKHINANNVNYGGLLAEWRIAVVEKTIESLYFWTIVLLGGSAILMAAYISWLLHERDNRLHITGSIIAQLWNAHVFARSKALEAIAAHNKLVEKIDAMTAPTPAQPAAMASSGPAAVATNPPGTMPEESPQAGSTAGDVGLPGDIPRGLFEQTPMASTSRESAASGPHEGNNDALPLSVKAARGEWSRQQQPSVKASVPSETIETLDAKESSSEPEADSATNGNDDVAALKQTLQRALAQIATKDVQLTAKDGKIASQRQLISDLNNKLKVENMPRGEAR